ncbi:DUF2917 domain-containing protein [Piscinibacter gummiphilus]|nr:DUF2917 domain-containing protein [Piscinibacter gummiphilus]
MGRTFGITVIVTRNASGRPRMNIPNMAPISSARPQADGWSQLFTMEPGTPVRLVCTAEVSVTCLSGTAWITTASDTRDVVLTPGQRHVAARRDRLFINGMPRCVLRFDSSDEHQPIPVP